jgi:hypothetical protein
LRAAGEYIAAPGRLANIAGAELVGVGTFWVAVRSVPGAARAVRNGAFDILSLRIFRLVCQQLLAWPQGTPQGALAALQVAFQYLRAHAQDALGNSDYYGYLMVLAGLLAWTSSALYLARRTSSAQLWAMQRPDRRTPPGISAGESVGLGAKSVFSSLFVLGGEALVAIGARQTVLLGRFSDWVYVIGVGAVGVALGAAMVQAWAASDRRRVADAKAALAEAERVARLRRWTEVQKQRRAAYPDPRQTVSGPVFEKDFDTLKRLGLFDTRRAEDGSAEPAAPRAAPGSSSGRNAGRAPPAPPRPPPPEPVAVEDDLPPREVSDACVLLDLRLGPTLTIEEVETSYRQLIDLVHPDRNKNPLSTKQTVRLNNARDALVRYLRSRGVAR